MQVHTIDLNFQSTDHTIATYLVETQQGLVLIESGPYSCYKTLEGSISSLGYHIEDIRHVLLTHIHFDHAGSSWKLAELGADIYVHPFGARHLIDPEKLLSSAKMIYKDQMDSLWGEIRPISKEKVIPVEDNETFELAGLTFRAHHTPGHARHHICWELGDLLFAGDVAGVKIADGPAMPPCPPPDIDIEQWNQSIDCMLSLQPKTLYLTHFGSIKEHISDHLFELKEELSSWSLWIKEAWTLDRDQEKVLPEFVEFVAGRLKSKGLSQAQIHEYELANPAFMSVAGLYRYWDKKEPKA